jgi:hypothetical protein
MAIFLSLQWHCCHPQASIVALFAMVLLLSLMSRGPCHHHDGIVALIVMVLLPLCAGICAFITMVIVALVTMGSLL